MGKRQTKIKIGKQFYVVVKALGSTRARVYQVYPQDTPSQPLVIKQYPEESKDHFDRELYAFGRLGWLPSDSKATSEFSSSEGAETPATQGATPGGLVPVPVAPESTRPRVPATQYAIVRPYGYDEKQRALLEEYIPDSIETVFSKYWAQPGSPEHEALAKSLIYHMAAALSVIHDCGIIHRDINPGNILHTDGHFYLIDFGWATGPGMHGASGGAGDKDANQEKFRPPEQDQGKELTQAGDIYSLGLVLYYAWTGQNYDKRKPAQLREPIFPMWLANLLAKMLESDPKKRIQNGRDLATELPHFLANEAEWLISDEQWESLNEDHERMASVTPLPNSGTRFGRGVLCQFEVSPDGDILAVARAVSIRLHSISDNRRLVDLPVQSKPVALAWKPEPPRRKLLAIAYTDRTVQILNPNRPDSSVTLQLPPHPQELTCLAWAPGNINFLALGGRGGSVYIWKIPDIDQLSQSSPGKSTLAESHPRQIKELHHGQMGITAVSWSPDGQRLASASEDRNINVWERIEAASRTEYDFVHKASFLSADKPITRLAWLDQEIILLAQGQKLSKLQLYSPGNERWSLRPLGQPVMAHSTGIDELVINRKVTTGDQSLVVTAARDGTVKIWDNLRQEQIQTPIILIQHSVNHPTRVSFVGNRFLLTGSQDQEGLHQYHCDWNRKRVRYHRTMRVFDYPITALSWLPDSSPKDMKGVYILLLGDRRGTMTRWGVDARLPLLSEFITRTAMPVGPRFTSLGPELRPGFGAVLDLEARWCDQPRRALIAVLFAGHNLLVLDWCTAEFSTIPTGGLRPTATLAWHPSLPVIAFGCEMAGVGLAQIDMSDQGRQEAKHLAVDAEFLRHIPGRGGRIRRLAFSPDGTKLAVISDAFDLRILSWSNSEKGQVALRSALVEFSYPTSSPLTDVAWAADGTRCAFAGENGNIWIVDHRHDSLVSLNASASPKIYAVRLAATAAAQAQDYLVAALSDNTVAAWKWDSIVEDRRPLATFRGHTDRIADLKFSGDGAWLASASEDGSVTLYATDRIQAR